MDISIIQAAVTSMRTAYDIAKGMQSLNTMSEVQSTVIVLQKAILEAQEAALDGKRQLLEAEEEMRGLRAQIARATEWDADKSRYTLTTANGGSTVFALKGSAKREGEPAHYLCPNCFYDGRRSLLQNATSMDTSRATDWACGVCKLRVSTGYGGSVEAKYINDLGTPAK
jgi:hypothetical protein